MEQKLSVKDLTVANERITAETARQFKLSETKVTEFVNFLGSYTADVIRTGAMETVMIPYFGKFRVKTKVLRYLKSVKQAKLNGKDVIWKAMNGKSIKPDTDDNTTNG